MNRPAAQGAGGGLTYSSVLIAGQTRSDQYQPAERWSDDVPNNVTFGGGLKVPFGRGKNPSQLAC